MEMLHRARLRFYKWLFGTPTTVLEAINVLYLMIWGVAILNDDLASMPFYAGFLGEKAVHVNDKAAVLFFIAAVFSLVGMSRGTRKSSKSAAALQGFALQLSAILWLAVSLNFLAHYPPLHIAVLTYGVWALMCWVAGRYAHKFSRFKDQVHVYGE